MEYELDILDMSWMNKVQEEDKVRILRNLKEKEKEKREEE